MEDWHQIGNLTKLCDSYCVKQMPAAPSRSPRSTQQDPVSSPGSASGIQCCYWSKWGQLWCKMEKSGPEIGKESLAWIPCCPTQRGMQSTKRPMRHIWGPLVSFLFSFCVSSPIFRQELFVSVSVPSVVILLLGKDNASANPKPSCGFQGQFPLLSDNHLV